MDVFTWMCRRQDMVEYMRRVAKMPDELNLDERSCRVSPAQLGVGNCSSFVATSCDEPTFDIVPQSFLSPGPSPCALLLHTIS